MNNNDKHNGKAITEWIDILYKKYNDLYINVSENKVDSAKDIPFQSKLYAADNLFDAVNEAKGALVGNIDITGFKYKGEAISDLLNLVKVLNNYKPNSNMVNELSPNNKDVSGVTETIDELIRIIYRLKLQVDELEDKISSLEARNE